MKTVLLLAISALLCTSLGAQNIYGKYRGALEVSSDQETSITVNIEDLFALVIEGDNDFLEGFELELRLPAELYTIRDSFALFAYDGLHPSPSQTIQAYTGRELGYNVLPFSAKMIVRYQFTGIEQSRPDPDIAAFRTEINPARLPLLFSVVPVIKGFPSAIYASQISVTARPLLSRKGAVSLALNNEFPVTVRINDSLVLPPWNRILLNPGIHTLTLESDHYEPLTRKFGIERGQKQEISFSLVKKVPRISFAVPDMATVFLNGERLTEPGNLREIAPGEHALIISLGDHHLTKTLEIEAGRTYSIQLFMDLITKVD